jgi:hypothetical protein
MVCTSANSKLPQGARARLVKIGDSDRNHHGGQRANNGPAPPVRRAFPWEFGVDFDENSCPEALDHLCGLCAFRSIDVPSIVLQTGQVRVLLRKR